MLPPLYNGRDEETCGLEFLPCSNLLIVSLITMHNLNNYCKKTLLHHLPVMCLKQLPWVLLDVHMQSRSLQ